MSWRNWIYGKLTTAPIDALVAPASVFAGGSITVAPETKPFVIYRIGANAPRLRDGGSPVATARFAEVWVYDDPGAYDRIDSILGTIRGQLVGPVPEPDKTCCEWIGDSGELADDALGAITRNSVFQLIGGGS